MTTLCNWIMSVPHFVCVFRSECCCDFDGVYWLWIYIERYLPRYLQMVRTHGSCQWYIIVSVYWGICEWRCIDRADYRGNHQWAILCENIAVSEFVLQSVWNAADFGEYCFVSRVQIAQRSRHYQDAAESAKD